MSDDFCWLYTCDRIPLFIPNDVYKMIYIWVLITSFVELFIMSMIFENGLKADFILNISQFRDQITLDSILGSK